MADDTHQKTDPLPEPVTTRRSRFPLVWIAPVLALVIGIWLIFDELDKRGPKISITFNDGSGIEKGKTQITYRGVKVGTVETVELATDLNNVVVTAVLEKAYANIASADSIFWIVRPEIGLRGITGLDTLMSGQYIAVQPGGGAPTLSFTGQENPPPSAQDKPGLNVIVQTNSLGSITEGSPVYYREVQVGAVDRIRLSETAQKVLIHLHIDKPYDALVRQNTRFWNASGLNVSLGLTGIKVHSESLESLLAGGIAFATPNNPDMGDTVPAGSIFDLATEADSSWSEWNPTIALNFTPTTTTGADYFPTSTKSAIHEPEGTTQEEQTKPQQLPHSPQH